MVISRVVIRVTPFRALIILCIIYPCPFKYGVRIKVLANASDSRTFKASAPPNPGDSSSEINGLSK